MAEYPTRAQARNDIRCHVEWVSKYCCKLLRAALAELVLDLVRQMCRMRDVVVVRVAADHVNRLAPVYLPPPQLVRNVTGRSSRRLRDEFPPVRKGYWGLHL